MKKQIDSLGTGSTFKAITLSTLCKIEIPLPPLDDQKRIVHLLGKVEGLIVQRKKGLEQLDELLKSIFLQMFGDPVRNEKGWKKVNLGSVIDIQSGQVDPRTEPYSEMLHVGGANIESQTGRLIDLKMAKLESLISGKYLFDERCILYSKIRPYLNKVAKPNFKGICSADIYPIRPKKTLNIHFLATILGTTDFLLHAENKSDRTSIPKINRKAMEGYQFYLPPLPLQNKFAAIVEKVEGIKAHYQKNLTELEALYGVLSQKAFAGELDLARIPLPILHKKEIHVNEEKVIESEQKDYDFKFPMPATSDAWKNPKGLHYLIEEWIRAWVSYPDHIPFSTQSFMDAAQVCLNEIAQKDQEDPPVLGIAEYDVIRDWIFNSLKQKNITQTQNITHKNDKDEPVFGNKVVLS